jgi:hypothetical protein
MVDRGVESLVRCASIQYIFRTSVGESEKPCELQDQKHTTELPRLMKDRRYLKAFKAFIELYGLPFST